MADIRPESQTLTREEFYERVWQVPATKLAADLGCSDVMIGKVCRAFKIPKPYPGYWARLESGKTPRKTPLPKNNDPAAQSLAFCRQPKPPATTHEPPPEPEADSDIRILVDRAKSLGPVVVSQSLRRPHPLVEAASNRLRINRIPYFERSRADQALDIGPTIAVQVTEATTRRALCIMDALIKRVEKIGGSVELREQRWRPQLRDTVICFAGEDVATIRIREKLSVVRVPPEKKKHSWDRNAEQRGSGQLILDSGPSYESVVYLRDSPKQRRIEDGLNDLIISLVEKAGQIRTRRREEIARRERLEAEERIRRQQEEELRWRREELKKRQDEEQERVDELLLEAENWRRSELIREYLSAVCDMLLERYGSIRIEGQAAAFLRWGCQQADRFDPLRESPPSILDEKI